MRRISEAKLKTMDIDDVRDIADDFSNYEEDTCYAAQRIVNQFDYWDADPRTEADRQHAQIECPSLDLRPRY